MNDDLMKAISSLPREDISPEKLDKIKRILPIPYEQEVLWINVVSTGGHPAAYAITDKAFIYKASKADVNATNKAIKDKNKEKEKQEKLPTVNYIYQIVPWDHYSPELINLYVEKTNKGKETYKYTFDGERIVSIEDRTLYDFFNSYNESIKASISSAATMADLGTLAVGDQILAGGPDKVVGGINYNLDLGKGNTNSGHGIYAEDVNNHIDRIHKKKATVVGRNNAKNGPDRIVNNHPVQTKYYSSASRTVNACFDKKSGDFKYLRIDNNKPMQIEVPSDQYTDAINILKQKIQEGKVPGVTDPNQANQIIRKGNISYKRARNLAKAGNIDSLKFDARTNAVHCVSVMGISAVVAFAFTYWSTKSIETAAKNAVKTGIQVFGTSFLSSVLASQVARTQLHTIFKPLIHMVSIVIGPQRTQNFINSFRSISGKKAIAGVAAQKSFEKFLATELTTGLVMFVVFSIPDTYRVLTGKISKAQYTKNMFILGANFAGAAAGAAVGAKLGAKVGNLAGPVGFVGGFAGGAIAGGLARLITNAFREDDVVIMGRMINEYISIAMIDNMFNDEEQNQLIELLNKDNKGLKELVQKLICSQNQEKDIMYFLRPKIKKVISTRKRIKRKHEKVIGYWLDLYFRGDGAA